MDMQTPPPHFPPLRSGHLKKMRNVLDIKMGVKFHIAFGRCERPKGAILAPKNLIFFKIG